MKPNAYITLLTKLFPWLVVLCFLVFFLVGYLGQSHDSGAKPSGQGIRFCKDPDVPFAYTTFFNVVTFQIKKNGVEIETDIPLMNIPGVLSAGLAYEISSGPDTPSSLYVVIKNQRGNVTNPENKIYCLDLETEPFRIIVNDSQKIGIYLSKQGLVLIVDGFPFLHYYQEVGRQVLEIDNTHDGIYKIEFSSGTPPGDYRVYPDTEYHCPQVKNSPEYEFIKVFLVCASDGTDRIAKNMLPHPEQGNFFSGFAKTILGLTGALMAIGFFVFVIKYPSLPTIFTLISFAILMAWVILHMLHWIPKIFL